MWPILNNLLRIHSLPQKNGTKPLLLYIVTNFFFSEYRKWKGKIFQNFQFLFGIWEKPNSPNKSIKNKSSFLYILNIENKRNPENQITYIFWHGQLDRHKRSSDSSGDGSFCAHIAHTACGSCSSSYQNSLFLFPTHSFQYKKIILHTHINIKQNKQTLVKAREIEIERKRESTISFVAERSPELGFWGRKSFFVAFESFDINIAMWIRVLIFFFGFGLLDRWLIGPGSDPC